MYADVDLGGGFEKPVVKCKFSDETFNDSESILTYKAPEIFDASLPYFFRSTDQVNLPTNVSAATGKVKLQITSQGQSVAVSARLAYASGFIREKPNSYTLQTFAGSIVTYSSTGVDCVGVLELRGLTKEDGVLLENFIVNVIRLNLNFFTLEVIA